MKKLFVKTKAASVAKAKASALAASASTAASSSTVGPLALMPLADATAVAASDSTAASSSTVAPSALVPIAEPDLIELKGKLGRIIDEALGYGVAGEMAEVVGAAGGQLLCRIQKAGSSKVGRNVTVKRSQLTLASEIAPSLPMKKLLLSFQHKVELDAKFPAEELEKGVSLKKDSRLASIHIDMCWWMICRDLVLNQMEIAYLEPDFSATALYQISQPDGAEAFVRALAAVKGKVAAAKLVLLPVWGGIDGSEHWTLLQLSKKEVWEVTYKDSLTAMCKNSAEVAEKLLTVMSAALEQDIKMPTDRANAARQGVGSGACGYFIVHWMEEACRRHIGEGEMANGFPDPARWFPRLETLVAFVKKAKGFSIKKDAKVEAKMKELKVEADKIKEIAQKLVADEKVKAQAAKLALEFSRSTWASTGGCPKCRFARLGSTCCNPDKITALLRAREIKQKEMKEKGLEYVVDSYDKDTYNAEFEKVWKDIAASKSIPPVPSILKPAGGKVQLKHSLG